MPIGTPVIPQDLRPASSPTFAGLTLSGLTSGRIPFASAGGLLADEANLTHVAGGSNIAIGNDHLDFTALNFYLDGVTNSSNVSIRTKSAAGVVNTFLFNLDGIFVLPRSFRIYKDGSDAVGTGPHTYIANADNTRAWITAQLSNSFHIDQWYYNGATWVTLHRFETTGRVGLGTGQTPPTATLHLKAGTATASTAPLKFNSGTLLGTPEAGAVEFLTDDFYTTITTGAARKMVVLNDGTVLTSGTTPVASTNGRLIDGKILASGTYSATITAVTNCTVTTPATLQYFRVGNVVAVSGMIYCDPTVAGLVQLNCTLPVASDLASVIQLAGVGAGPSSGGPEERRIYGDAVNNVALIDWYAVQIANHGMCVSFTYLIV